MICLREIHPSPGGEIAAKLSRSRGLDAMEAIPVMRPSARLSDLMMYMCFTDVVSPWFTICRCRKVEAPPGKFVVIGKFSIAALWMIGPTRLHLDF